MGGFVLFGVTDKGEIVGQQVATSTLEDVANELRRIEPPIFPGIESVALTGGNSVIALRVTVSLEPKGRGNGGFSSGHGVRQRVAHSGQNAPHAGNPRSPAAATIPANHGTFKPSRFAAGPPGWRQCGMARRMPGPTVVLMPSLDRHARPQAESVSKDPPAVGGIAASRTPRGEACVTRPKAIGILPRFARRFNGRAMRMPGRMALPKRSNSRKRTLNLPPIVPIARS